MKIFTTLILLFTATLTFSQGLDSLRRPRLSAQQMVMPSAFIAAGFLSHEFEVTQYLHERIDYYRFMWVEDPLRFDDVTQFVPITAALFLDDFGVKAKHNRWERMMQASIGTALTLGTIYTIKELTDIQRPNLRSYDSFPSGHTALAFMGADQVHREYGDQSIWYPIGAYTVATITGFMRMYNDKHWLGDVVAGAGIGIIMSRISNWLTPNVLRRSTYNRPLYIDFMSTENGAGLVLSF